MTSLRLLKVVAASLVQLRHSPMKSERPKSSSKSPSISLSPNETPRTPQHLSPHVSVKHTHKPNHRTCINTHFSQRFLLSELTIVQRKEGQRALDSPAPDVPTPPAVPEFHEVSTCSAQTVANNEQPMIVTSMSCQAKTAKNSSPTHLEGHEAPAWPRLRGAPKGVHKRGRHCDARISIEHEQELEQVSCKMRRRDVLSDPRER